jgi:RNA polymerase sporulation-specific sigma factor
LQTLPSHQEYIELHNEFLETEDSSVLSKIYSKANKDFVNLPDDILISLYAFEFDLDGVFEKKAQINNYNVNDEILCHLSNLGDQNAQDILVLKYIKPVEKIIKNLRNRGRYNKGYELDDLIQSGYIGFYKAMKDFKIEKRRPFDIFVKHVITRHINSLISRSNNNKLKSLNEAFSYHTPISSDSEITYEQLLKTDDFSPMAHIIKQETFYEFWELLSDSERTVLWYVAESYSYKDIASKVFQKTHDTSAKRIKAVDNTIQRINNKRDSYFNKKGDVYINR